MKLWVQLILLLFFFFLLLTSTLFVVALVIAWLVSKPLLRRRRPDSEVSPQVLGLPAEPLAFQSRDNKTTLRGFWIPAQDAIGTIVLCGGQRGSLDGDLPSYGPMFHQAGFNLVAFDWRAHGRSEGEKITFGVYEKEDLLGLLDFLAARGVERVGVMGLSMGANVGMIAASLSERVTALVCDGLTVSLTTALVSTTTRWGIPRWVAVPAVRWVLIIASFRVGGNLFHANPWRWAQHVGNVPALLIHGSADPLVKNEEILWVYDRLSSPTKTLWRVPGAGHREAFVRAPEEYRRRVVDWFTVYLAGRVPRSKA